MAANQPRRLQLDEEIEGDRRGTTDFVFRRIGESVPLKPRDSAYDLEDPPLRPLAVSDRLGALFLAHSEGFLVAKTKDVIRIAKEIKEKGSGPCIEGSSVMDVRIGRVSILALSADSSTLAAAVGGDISFYSVASLLNKEQTPSFSCSLEKAYIVKDVKWQKSGEKSFLVLSIQASLYYGNLNDQLKHVMDNVDAVDWSTKGDLVVVGKRKTLSILSSDFKEQFQMSLLFKSWPNIIDSDCVVKVDSINWVRDDSIVVGCVGAGEDGDEDCYLVQVITCGDREFTESSCIPKVYSFPDLFGSISDDVFPNGAGLCFLSSYLDSWELALVSNKKSIDDHFLLLEWTDSDNTREVVSLDFQNDQFPRIDLQENGDDNLILGLGVDRVSVYEKVTVQVGSDVEERAPYCILLCLTCEGKLIMFHSVRISEPPVLRRTSLTSPIVNNSALGNYAGAITLESELSPVKPREASVEGVISNVKLRPASAEAPRLLFGNDHNSFGNFDTPNISQNKEQTSASSSGQVANMGPVSAEAPKLFFGSDHKSFGNLDTPNISQKKEQTNGTAGQVANDNQLPMQLPHRPGSVPPLKSTGNTGSQQMNFPFSGRVAATSLSVENISSEEAATVEASFEKITRSGVMGKGAVSTNTVGAPSGSQSMGKFSIAGAPVSQSSAFPFSMSIQSDTQGKSDTVKGTKSSIFPQTTALGNQQSGGRPFSSIGSTRESPSLMFSSTKSTPIEGHATVGTRTKSTETEQAIHATSSLTHEASLPGKSLSTSTQPLLPNTRSARRSHQLDSEPEISKQFYNVKDMVKELDILLSSIEKEGGFKDACTVSQKSSLLALEEGLQFFFEMSRRCKSKLEERLLEIQLLQDKMLQVSAREVYMEGIVKQVSNDHYWDIWNRQKLSPEFEMKRQSILNANQILTNQLIELEKHFNALEINRFGETRRLPSGRRGSSRLEPPRQTQSLHTVYNTLSSQLAAAQQLSGCLSTQMAMLNINSPNVKRQSVAKELFESIGLTPGTSAFQSPEAQNGGLTPDRIQGFSPSSTNRGKEYRGRNASNAFKGSGLETTRRSRDSLDKTLCKFEPQKTTVKRLSQQGRFKVAAEKPLRITEAFDTQVENFSDGQPKLNGSSSSPFANKIHQFDGIPKGIQEESSKLFSQSQSHSVFKWAKGHSGSSSMDSKSQSIRSLHSTGQMFPSPSPSSIVQNTMKATSSPTKDASEATFLESQPNSSAVRTDTVSKATSITQSQKYIANQMFSEASRITSPTKGTLTTRSQASEHLNLKVVGEGSIRSPPRSTKQIAPGSSSIMSNESNPTSVDSISFVPLTSLGLNTSQFDKKVNKNQGSESIPMLSKEPVLTTSASSAFTSSPVALSVPPVSFSTLSLGSSQLNKNTIGETKQDASILVTSSSSSSVGPFRSISPLQSQKPRTPEVTVPTSQSLPSFNANFGTKPTRAQTSPNVDPAPLSDISSKLEHAVSRTPEKEKEVSDELTSKREPGLVPHNTNDVPPAVKSPSEIPSSITPIKITTVEEKDENVEVNTSQEDEMEEEAPDTTNVLNFGSLGGFGLGSTPTSTAAPKSNPFGVSFGSSPTSFTNPVLNHTSSPGELFRPASLNLPSAQPAQQPQAVNPSGSSGGFSAFGQPAQFGAGQQALGSVLGSFGQSRQLGSGVQGFNFASGGFGGSGFSASANSGGFASTGGGFTSFASGGGGFPRAAGVGGFAGVASTSGGFASANTGGGFAAAASGGSGFAAAAAAPSAPGGFGRGGFAAAASSTTGGFGGATPSGGFPAGGFEAFSGNKGGVFSAFGGSGAAGTGRPPSELFTQMRK